MATFSCDVDLDIKAKLYLQIYFLEASLLVGMALALLFYERKNMNWRVIFFHIELFFFFIWKKKDKANTSALSQHEQQYTWEILGSCQLCVIQLHMYMCVCLLEDRT